MYAEVVKLCFSTIFKHNYNVRLKNNSLNCSNENVPPSAHIVLIAFYCFVKIKDNRSRIFHSFKMMFGWSFCHFTYQHYVISVFTLFDLVNPKQIVKDKMGEKNPVGKSLFFPPCPECVHFFSFPNWNKKESEKKVQNWSNEKIRRIFFTAKLHFGLSKSDVWKIKVHKSKGRTLFVVYV